MNKINLEEFELVTASQAIDYFLTSASFEKRCFVIPNIISNRKYKSVIFYNYNEYEEVVENAKTLQKILEGDLVKLNTGDPIHNYNIIFQFISQIPSISNILIDSTTFTHETLLVLIRLLQIFPEKIGTISVAYVGAREYSVNIDKDEDKWLSKGIDEIRTVIGYPGISDPTRKNHLLVLFGFESERTKKIIEAYEYDVVTLGFGDEPIAENHMKINYERHKQLLAETSNAKDFQFCLVDPLKTKEQILAYLSLEQFAGMNTVVAPLNNKLSTIGAGLAAIQNDNIQISYAKPNLYNAVGYSVPNDDIYICNIDFEC